MPTKEEIKIAHDALCDSYSGPCADCPCCAMICCGKSIDDLSYKEVEDGYRIMLKFVTGQDYDGSRWSII